MADVATHWCGGRGQGATRCQRRTECAHYRAFLDHAEAHPHEPIPTEVFVGWRLCSSQYEHFKARER
jgi:hypothetical protein